jgi:hypothetical protein
VAPSSRAVSKMFFSGFTVEWDWRYFCFFPVFSFFFCEIFLENTEINFFHILTYLLRILLDPVRDGSLHSTRNEALCNSNFDRHLETISKASISSFCIWNAKPKWTQTHCCTDTQTDIIIKKRNIKILNLKRKWINKYTTQKRKKKKTSTKQK